MKRSVLFVYFALVCVVLLVIMAAVWPAVQNQIRYKKQLEASYRTAVSALEEADYVQAYEILAELGSYKDSQEKQVSIREDYLDARLSGLSGGETVYLGHFGGEVLSWTVTAVGDGYAVLVCNRSLDKMPYNDRPGSYATVGDSAYFNEWYKCTLRRWLNKEFLGAFTQEEMALLKRATVSGSGVYKVEKSVEDFVYILSKEEMEEAVRSGWDADNTLREGVFWLRGSAGTNGKLAQCHNAIEPDGMAYIEYSRGVIPVIWVSTNTASVS